jgi:hypothetical protein
MRALAQVRIAAQLLPVPLAAAARGSQASADVDFAVNLVSFSDAATCK